MTSEARRLDTSELKERVQRMYEEVALEPEHEFHFETGRLLAERLARSKTRASRSRRGAPTPSTASSLSAPTTRPRSTASKACRCWRGCETELTEAMAR